MALTAVKTAGANVAPITAEELDSLQWEQFQHDEKYHREIARLSVQDRLKHMALHFAKYAGALIEAADSTTLQRIVTDTFIIAVSSINTLNVRLTDALQTESDKSTRPFVDELAVQAGRMAAACEKLDHMEDFPFRPTVRAAATNLVCTAMAEADAQGWNLPDLVRRRLAGVKQKMIFHGRI